MFSVARMFGRMASAIKFAAPSTNSALLGSAIVGAGAGGLVGHLTGGLAWEIEAAAK